jgi:hypothetical protein
MKGKSWESISGIVELKSPWVTLIAEKLKDDQGKILEYWRVEKADSVIVITIHNQQLLLPVPVYRPGVKQVTLDFAGGRIPVNVSPQTAAIAILYKELGIKETQINKLTPINQQGWLVNSSFSNQQLYGFVAEITSTVNVDPSYLGRSYPLTSEGINQLLQELNCLQCRALLQEWQLKNILTS